MADLFHPSNVDRLKNRRNDRNGGKRLNVNDSMSATTVRETSLIAML